MCFHSAVVTKKEVIQDALFCRRSRGNHHFLVGPIIRGGGSFMPTASMMIRKSFFDRAFADQGTFYKRYMTGYFYQIHCSLEDGAYYIDRPMSVYRSFSEGSWTQRISQDQTMYRRWLLNYLESLRETDKMTNHVYSDDIMIVIRRCHLSVLNNDSIDMAFRRDYFNNNRNEIGFWGGILWFGVFSMPTTHAVVRRIRTLMQMLRKQLTKFGR